MSTVFLILALVAMAATLATLASGVVGMAKNGPFNRRWGNRLMQLRVLFQGLAIVFLALALFAS